ncbi:nuclear transport factor 2 family protein [Streptomyces sp. STR69]|uniref:nuclear transport factor 2 family protein n=1 Tax=Streptomyces sp. STR69 TaxID=1796942 RepID=UPI0021C97322|nr:nuclear transport factor 2 family protein [Streptomyces sp. STR69]
MPAPPPPSTRPAADGGARPGGAPAELAEVWTVITGMYEAYTAGDRERIDGFLDPEATIWDSATRELIRGRTELNQVRDGRPTSEGGPDETGLTAYDQVVDVFGDLAVARYWLRVDYRAAPPELARITAVLRRARPEGQWLVVHLHEDIHGQPAVDGG